jgi:hypothetical protein
VRRRLFSRRRTDAVLIAKLAAENAAQRVIIADLGRRLHRAQGGNTVTLPRSRSDRRPTIDVTAPGPADQLHVAWPPEAWRT